MLCVMHEIVPPWIFLWMILTEYSKWNDVCSGFLMHLTVWKQKKLSASFLFLMTWKLTIHFDDFTYRIPNESKHDMCVCADQTEGQRKMIIPFDGSHWGGENSINCRSDIGVDWKKNKGIRDLHSFEVKYKGMKFLFRNVITVYSIWSL